MEMTIKQLANQLGVSKTTISNAISSLGLQRELKQSGNKYLLSEVQIKSVKLQIESQKSQTASENILIEVLQKQLTLLNEQLGIKDEQIRAYQDMIRLLQEARTNHF